MYLLLIELFHEGCEDGELVTFVTDFDFRDTFSGRRAEAWAPVLKRRSSCDLHLFDRLFVVRTLRLILRKFNSSLLLLLLGQCCCWEARLVLAVTTLEKNFTHLIALMLPLGSELAKEVRTASIQKFLRSSLRICKLLP